jgi:hypothetical protein
MSNQATINKFDKELQEIKDDLRSLRSFAIGMVGDDPEGLYKPEFVQEVLRARHEKPVYTFRGKTAFLAELRRHNAR